MNKISKHEKIKVEEFIKIYNESSTLTIFQKKVGHSPNIEDYVKSIGLVWKFIKRPKTSDFRLSNIDDQTFIEEFYKSTSLPEFCNSLGFEYQKHIYKIFKNRISELNLPLTHHKIRAFNEDMHDEIFCISKIYRGSSVLSRYIQRSKIKEYKCVHCGLVDEWNNKKLVLHLDHINGNKLDNRLSNLRYLCPNCHSQTETYCSRNKKGIIKDSGVVDTEEAQG